MHKVCHTASFDLFIKVSFYTTISLFYFQQNTEAFLSGQAEWVKLFLVFPNFLAFYGFDVWHQNWTEIHVRQESERLWVETVSYRSPFQLKPQFCTANWRASHFFIVPYQVLCCQNNSFYKSNICLDIFECSSLKKIDEKLVILTRGNVGNSLFHFTQQVLFN